MLTKTRKVIGLAVEANQILLAELHCSSLRHRVVRTETFDLLPETGYAQPEPLGAALHQFLRRHHFSAREVIIGLPAKWLLVKESEIPSVAANSLGPIVRLMAEREFSLEINDLVLDYTSGGEADANRLLVMATLRRTVEPILAAVRAAGLKVLTVTSSALALSGPVPPAASGSNHVLYLRANYAEILTRNGSGFHSIKHLSYATGADQDPTAAPDSLLRQLNHYFALTPGRAAGGPRDTLFIWEGPGQSAETYRAYEQRLGRPVQIRSGLEQLQREHWDGHGAPETTDYAAAICLALSPLRAQPIAIDFVHSKIAAQVKHSRKKPLLWSVGSVALLLIAGGLLLGSWQRDKHEITRITNALAAMKTEVDAVESLAEKVVSVQDWYADRPKILDCLRELSLSFPEEGTIWVNSLALREDMRGILTGKAQSESDVLEVMDKLKTNKVFSNVQLLYLRDTGRNSRDSAFAIDFIYTNGK
ncbi:MAG: hypothetical protein JW810_01155 [Sedimentisphaerales bacterium]|nr:hypothetical protein [Sedimentisphaerales bacterium]